MDCVLELDWDQEDSGHGSSGEEDLESLTPVNMSLNDLDIYVLQVICSKLSLKERMKFERLNTTFFGLCDHLWSVQSSIPEDEQLSYDEYKRMVIKCPKLKRINVERMRDGNQDRVSTEELQFCRETNFPSVCPRIESFEGNPSVHFVAYYLHALGTNNHVKNISVTRDFIYDYNEIIEDIRIIAVNSIHLQKLDFFSFIIPDGDPLILLPYYKMMGQRLRSFGGFYEEYLEMGLTSKLEELSLMSSYMNTDRVPQDMHIRHPNLKVLKGRFKQPSMNSILQLKNLQSVMCFSFGNKKKLNIRESFVKFLETRGQKIKKLGLMDINDDFVHHNIDMWHLIQSYCPKLEVLKIYFDKRFNADVHEDQFLSCNLIQMKQLRYLKIRTSSEMIRVKAVMRDNQRIQFKYIKEIKPRLWAEIGPFF